MSQPKRQSSQAPKRTTQLEAPSVALNSYLASMLEDATAQEDDDPEWGEDDVTLTDLAEDARPEAVESVKTEPEPESRSIAKPTPKPSAKPTPNPEPKPIASAPTAEVQPQPAKPAKAEAETTQVPQARADTRHSDEATPDVALTESQLDQTATPLAWEANGRPAWAAKRFDCLLFKVDGLALAVPMVLLGTIYPMDRELTPLFGQPKWFLGLLPVQDKRNIKVIETAHLVMPERYRAEAAESLAYAIGIHGCDWALACHEVVGSITLQPGDVKWRSERTRRPWLAGTVVDHMCALIDLQAFEQVLLAPGKRRR